MVIYGETFYGRHMALTTDAQRKKNCNKGTAFERSVRKKKNNKSRGSATITNRSPSQTPRGRENQQKTNKHKSNKRTKSTKISSLFPKRGNRNAIGTEKKKKKKKKKKK